MDSGTLRSLEVTGPAVARMARARRRRMTAQVLMLASWVLLLPAILLVLLSGLLPPLIGEAAGYLLVVGFLLGFALWIPESFFRRREEAARHKAFPEVESALAGLRAGWQLEWYVPYGLGWDRLVTRGSWKQRFEWRVVYQGGTMLLTEIPAAEHQEDDDEDDEGEN